MQFINYHFQMNQITLSCSLSVAIRYLFAISTVQICPNFFNTGPIRQKNRTSPYADDIWFERSTQFDTVKLVKTMMARQTARCADVRQGECWV